MCDDFCVVYLFHFLNFKALDRMKFLHYIKAVLIAEQAPYDGDILDYNYKRNRTQGAHYTQGKLEIAVAIYAKRLYGAYKVQVQIHGAHKTTKKVKRLPDRYRIQSGQVDIGRTQWQREPTVKSQCQTKAGANGQLFVVYDEEYALHPAFALLQKVPEGEGRLFPHFAVDPVEGVALGHGRHGEVGVFGDAALGSVVECDCSFGARLTHHERALEQEESLVEFAQTKAKHANVGAHAKRVGQCGHPVDYFFVGVCY